ncbi:hypothetical protein [Salmonella enterica]|uniref:hypothetical protein n=1 Tax=Salmonella enterica TaxID=28901 RepID=UPI003F3D0E23|nr:hypothetical protein [Salmonella enterica subsp. enterica serovar Langford]
MDKAFSLSKIEEIDRQIAFLSYKPCQCEFYLEIKIRKFGGGEHYVRQCNQCGGQKGGALKAIDALDELKGQSPRTFDLTIEEKYCSELQVRSQKISQLSREKVKLLSDSSAEYESISLDQENKYREACQTLSEYIEAFSQSFGADKTLSALYQHEIMIKKEIRESHEKKLSLFSTETELKLWMFNLLKNDFYIYQEVSGVHITESLKVRIDYVLYPKAHLVNQGFEPVPFGIEVKYFTQAKDFVHKASRGIWQAISYNDCEFFLQNKKFRLKFCLLFSNLSFSDEKNLLELCSRHDDEKGMKWMGMLNVANHAKVGILRITGNKERIRGWSMSFAGGAYFSCHINGNEIDYKLSNANTINKIRVGNF